MPFALSGAMACCVVLRRLSTDVLPDGSSNKSCKGPLSKCAPDQDSLVTADASASNLNDRMHAVSDSPKTVDSGIGMKGVWSKVPIVPRAEHNLRRSSRKTKGTATISENGLIESEKEQGSVVVNPLSVGGDVKACDSADVNSKIRESRHQNDSRLTMDTEQESGSSTLASPRRQRKRASSVEWDWSGTDSPKVPQDKRRRNISKVKRAPSVDYEMDCSESDSDSSLSTNSCKLCKKKFSKPSKLRAHLRRHKDPNNPPFTCDEEGCSKGYFTKSHLDRHKSRSHSDLVTICQVKCPAEGCNKLFVTGCGLKRHINKVHVQQNLKYTCPTCNKQFPKHKQLRFHMAEHDGLPPVRCDICTVGFFSDSRLKQHMKSHKTYPCDVPGCEQVSQNYTSFSKHKAEHNRCFNTLKCAHCEKVLKTKRALRAHVMTHLDNKPVFKCTYDSCQRFYYQKRNLTSHIRVTHERVSSFMCDKPDCDKVFRSAKALAKHLNVHENGIAPYTRKKQAKRKDSGKPKRSMVSKLTGLRVPKEVEEKLLCSESKLSDSDIGEDSEREVNCTDFDFPASAEIMKDARTEDCVESLKQSKEHDVLETVNALGCMANSNNGNSEDLLNQEHSSQNDNGCNSIVEGVDSIPTSCDTVVDLGTISNLAGKVFEVGEGGILVEVDGTHDIPESNQSTVLSGIRTGICTESSVCNGRCENEDQNGNLELESRGESVNAEFERNIASGAEGEEMMHRSMIKGCEENENQTAGGEDPAVSCALSRDLEPIVLEKESTPETPKACRNQLLDKSSNLREESTVTSLEVANQSSSSFGVDISTLCATLCAETIVDSPSHSEREVLLVIPKVGPSLLNNEIASILNSEDVIRMLTGDIDVYSVPEISSPGSAPCDNPQSTLNGSTNDEAVKKISVDDPTVLKILQPLMQNLASAPNPSRERTCSGIKRLHIGDGIAQEVGNRKSLASSVVHQKARRKPSSEVLTNEGEAYVTPGDVTSTDNIVSCNQGMAQIIEAISVHKSPKSQQCLETINERTGDGNECGRVSQAMKIPGSTDLKETVVSHPFVSLAQDAGVSSSSKGFGGQQVLETLLSVKSSSAVEETVTVRAHSGGKAMPQVGSNDAFSKSILVGQEMDPSTFASRNVSCEEEEPSPPQQPATNFEGIITTPGNEESTSPSVVSDTCGVDSVSPMETNSPACKEIMSPSSISVQSEMKSAACPENKNKVSENICEKRAEIFLPTKTSVPQEVEINSFQSANSNKKERRATTEKFKRVSIEPKSASVFSNGRYKIDETKITEPMQAVHTSNEDEFAASTRKSGISTSKDSLKELRVESGSPCLQIGLSQNISNSEKNSSQILSSKKGNQRLLLNPFYVSTKCAQEEFREIKTMNAMRAKQQVREIITKLSVSDFERKPVRMAKSLKSKCKKQVVRNPACVHGLIKRLYEMLESDMKSHPLKLAKLKECRGYLQGPAKELPESDSSSFSESDNSHGEDSGSDDNDADNLEENDSVDDNASDDGNGGNGDDEDEEDEEADEQPDEDDVNEEEEDDNDDEENGDNNDPGQINGGNDDNNNDDGNLNLSDPEMEGEHDISNGQLDSVNGCDFGVDRKGSPILNVLSDGDLGHSSGSDNLVIVVDDEQESSPCHHAKRQSSVNNSPDKALFTSKSQISVTSHYGEQQNNSCQSPAKLLLTPQGNLKEDLKQNIQFNLKTPLEEKSQNRKSLLQPEEVLEKNSCRAIQRIADQRTSSAKSKRNKLVGIKSLTKWESTDSSDNEPLSNVVNKLRKVDKNSKRKRDSDLEDQKGSQRKVKLQAVKRIRQMNSKSPKRIKLRLVKVESDFEPKNKTRMIEKVVVVSSDDDGSNKLELDSSETESEQWNCSEDPDDPTWKPKKKEISSPSSQELSFSAPALPKPLQISVGSNSRDGFEQLEVPPRCSSTDPLDTSLRSGRINEDMVLKESVPSGFACRQLSEAGWLTIFRKAVTTWNLHQTPEED